MLSQKMSFSFSVFRTKYAFFPVSGAQWSPWFVVLRAAWSYIIGMFGHFNCWYSGYIGLQQSLPFNNSGDWSMLTVSIAFYLLSTKFKINNIEYILIYLLLALLFFFRRNTISALPLWSVLPMQTSLIYQLQRLLVFYPR